MIFIGDGETDIPSMKMVRLQGGHSIAVFDPNKFSEQSFQDKVYKLIEEDRVHFVAPADYQESSQLDVTVKGILARVARDVGQ
jgi:phosphotransacetylase